MEPLEPFFEIVTVQSDSTTTNLLNWCRRQKLVPDVSTYAPNRNRKWFNWEPMLYKGKPQIKLAERNERLFAFAQRVYPGCDAILLAGGKIVTNQQTEWQEFTIEEQPRKLPCIINWHGDAKYANPLAFGVNLGRAVFGYEWKRGDISSRKYYLLEPGTVYRFNCKLPHASWAITKERFSLNFWEFTPAYKQVAENFTRF